MALGDLPVNKRTAISFPPEGAPLCLPGPLKPCILMTCIVAASPNWKRVCGQRLDKQRKASQSERDEVEAVLNAGRYLAMVHGKQEKEGKWNC